ncbi:MFS transporter [Alicyclobacillus hesperidum]|uniref:MFS transporter n=1 Tax=Alicyclobacillus hesperidum TaxID=89784 RepID=A0A1H2VNK4_9BACL|nr:MFS transporter [Alicyclobacillus hesperidum]GLV12983.1 MFS transporter [Alicyclobacillus hesperidum]SDW69925.1 Sugar phosphate permease [Alicyclobacillus hesperidum]
MLRQESRYRWVVFFAVLIAYYFIVSQRTAPGLITNQLMRTFHISAATIGLLGSLQFLAYAVLQIPVGLLSDRFGPNRFLIVGALLNGLGTLLYSVSGGEYMLMVARFLVGMGDATIFVNFVSVVNQWFRPKEFINLLGVIGVAAGLGSLTATVPYAVWISAVGWRLPFFVIGIVIIACALLLYFVLVIQPNRKFPPKTDMHEGLLRPQAPVLTTLRRMFSTRQAWATAMCHFGLVGTYVGFIGSWGVPYFMQVFGMSRAVASSLLMCGLFGAMAGGPVTSALASRLGMTKRIYTFVHAITFVSWMTWFLLGDKPPLWAIVILLVLIGFGNGGSSLTFALVRDSFPIEMVGVVSGFSNMGGFVSAVLLPSLFGYVLGLFPLHVIAHGYHYGLVIPSLFSFVGLVGVRLVRQLKPTELGADLGISI